LHITETGLYDQLYLVISMNGRMIAIHFPRSRFHATAMVDRAHPGAIQILTNIETQSKEE